MEMLFVGSHWAMRYLKKAGFYLSREMFCAPFLKDMVKYLYAFLRS